MVGAPPHVVAQRFFSFSQVGTILRGLFFSLRSSILLYSDAIICPISNGVPVFVLNIFGPHHQQHISCLFLQHAKKLGSELLNFILVAGCTSPHLL